ncbi:MAG: hypothetical protein KIT73_20370, partial [Burkholderiales bacterium]|nr:hypothetical protein [Burkholderiales bacterium]
ATLERCGGVKKRSAEMLGVSLKTLYNRLESYASQDDDEEEGEEDDGPSLNARSHDDAGRSREVFE